MTSEANLDAIQRHLRALWRAETLILELKFRLLARRSGLMILAGVVGLFGLAMLNGAAFLALARIWGDVWAMLAVAAADLVIAAILAVIAAREPKSGELALASELRDQAVEAVQLDARIAVDEATGFMRRPVQMAGSASAVLIPMITAILRALRRRRSD